MSKEAAEQARVGTDKMSALAHTAPTGMPYGYFLKVMLGLDIFAYKAYNAYMEKEMYANFRANKEDLARLKEIAAIRRDSMIRVFHLLVQQEYERLHREKGGAHASHQENQAERD